MRYCRVCKQEKHPTDFYSPTKNICKKCSNAQSKASAKRNPERTTKRIRARRIQRTYGISIEEYNVLHKSQNGLCAICAQPESVVSNGIVSLSVDHCHKTQRVRGLLCRRCNAAIGLLSDDISRVEAALNYLKEN